MKKEEKRNNELYILGTTTALIAFVIIAMSIDSMMSDGFWRFIQGIVTAGLIGLICGIVNLGVYWILEAYYPKTLKKINNYFSEEENDYYE